MNGNRVITRSPSGTANWSHLGSNNQFTFTPVRNDDVTYGFETINAAVGVEGPDSRSLAIRWQIHTDDDVISVSEQPGTILEGSVEFEEDILIEGYGGESVTVVAQMVVNGEETIRAESDSFTMPETSDGNGSGGENGDDTNGSGNGGANGDSGEDMQTVVLGVAAVVAILIILRQL